VSEKQPNESPAAAQPQDIPSPVEIRKTLLANGYDPLPACGKRVFAPGWSSVDIDQAWLNQYERKRAWSNTGIRCGVAGDEGCLVGVDVDVDDPDMADRIGELANTWLGETWFWRGREGSERELWLYWSEISIRRQKTAKWWFRPLPRLDDEINAQVEILGQGCQFIAYGEHPDGGSYSWPEGSPLVETIENVPALDPNALEGFLKACEELFIAEGLERIESAAQSLSEGAHDYCLTPEMFFEVDNGMLSVSQIKDRLPQGDTWTCNLTAFRPDSDSEAGRISWDHAGEGLVIHDFVTGITYFEAFDLSVAGAELAKALAEVQETPNMFDNPKLVVLRDEWVYIESEHGLRHRDNPSRLLRWAAAQVTFAGTVAVDGKPRKLLTHWAATCATKAADAVLLPWSDERLVKTGAEVLFNTYEPPEHATGSGESDTFQAFIKHLFPKAREQSIFLDWLACKIQFPERRLHAMVMVAPEGGTGRNTLNRIIAQMLGPAYCVAPPFTQVLGSGYQAQYTEWLGEALLVFVDEAIQDSGSGGDGMDWRSRRRAYEKIKQVIDTGVDEKYIVRKGVTSSKVKVYASLLIATNHRDALAIDEGDRRLIVLDNGVSLASAGDLLECLHEWRRSPANIAEAYWWLSERDISGYDCYGMPPETGAKARMLEASESSLDRAYADFVGSAPGDLCTVDQVLEHCRMLRRSEDDMKDMPEGSKLRGALMSILRNRARHVVETDTKWQVRAGSDKKRFRPWVIRNFKKWCHEKQEKVHAPEIREELEKNGSPGGMASIGKGSNWS